MGYPEQTPEALNGQDIYAKMRLLAQVISGQTRLRRHR